jgi:hypothetical protein
VRALEWAKEADLMTACNFMLGFPEDTPDTLERTARFMERIAPMVDSFSTMGVVVPFPGTPLYDDNHVRYGFTGWWLDEAYSRYSAFPPVEDAHRFNRFYIDDANLDLDFFHYSEAMRDGIRACLRIKGEHNLRRDGPAARSRVRGRPGGTSRGGDPAMTGWDHADTVRYYEAFNRRHTRYRTANRALVRHAQLRPGCACSISPPAPGAPRRLRSTSSVPTAASIASSRRRRCARRECRSSTPGCAGLRTLNPPARDTSASCAARPSGKCAERRACIRTLAERLAPGGALCFDIPAAYVGEPDPPGRGPDPLLTELPAALARLGAGGEPQASAPVTLATPRRPACGIERVRARPLFVAVRVPPDAARLPRLAQDPGAHR